MAAYCVYSQQASEKGYSWVGVERKKRAVGESALILEEAKGTVQQRLPLPLYRILHTYDH